MPLRTLLEGTGKLDSNLQKLELARNVFSSSSSSDDSGLKVLVNDVMGTGGGGNIRAQFLGNVSTMAWTMPARLHQSKWFAHRGWMHSSPIMCHTLIWNWNAILRAFAIKGPYALAGTCFWRVVFMLARNTSMVFSAWPWAALWVMFHVSCSTVGNLLWLRRVCRH